MDVTLVMFIGSGERRDFPLSAGKSIVGRSTDSQIQIPLEIVSREHCEIRVKKESVRVRDLGSSNGTYVNNRRIQESALHAGDTLVVGPVVFTVVIDGEPTEITPVHTVLDEKKKKKEKSFPTPKPKAADETDSVDLDDSGELALELAPDDDDDENNPLAELEQLAKQKKF